MNVENEQLKKAFDALPEHLKKTFVSGSWDQGHELKTWPEYFEAVRTEKKNFEIRKNDRAFQVGDLLILREWDPQKETYSGRTAFRRITYILPGGQFGIDPDFVVLSIV